RADRGAGHLCATAGDRARGPLAHRRRAGHRAGAQGRRSGLLPAGGPCRALGRRRHAHARRHLSRLFRDVMTAWLNIVVQGVLVGGLYAMFAAGLSLIFGVMRLVNIAHGDLLVLPAYLALVPTQTVRLNPPVSLLLVVPLMAVIGSAPQRGILNRTLGPDLLPPLLVTFGLSVIIQNGLLELFTADSRKLQAGAIEVDSIQIAGISVGTLPLIQ